MASRDTLEDLIVYYEGRDVARDNILNTMVLLYADIAYLAKEIKELKAREIPDVNGVLHIG